MNKRIKLTRPDGENIWINVYHISSIQKSVDEEGYTTVHFSSDKKSTVKDSPELILKKIDEAMIND